MDRLRAAEMLRSDPSPTLLSFKKKNYIANGSYKKMLERAS